MFGRARHWAPLCWARVSTSRQLLLRCSNMHIHVQACSSAPPSRLLAPAQFYHLRPCKSRRVNALKIVAQRYLGASFSVGGRNDLDVL